MERPRRRRADERTVRKMQFETARRILFGTDIIPGTNPPREMWTSAGFLRGSKIQYMTPFPLGPFTFLVLQMDNINEIHPDEYVNLLERSDDTYVHAAVWIKMDFAPETIDGEQVTPQNMPQGITVNGEWVLIGALGADTFWPITPDFLRFCAIQVEKEDEATILNQTNRYPNRLHINSIDGGRIETSAYTFVGTYYDEDNPSEDLEESYSEQGTWYFTDNWLQFNWIQMSDKNDSVVTKIGSIDTSVPFEGDGYSESDHEIDVDNDIYSAKIHGRVARSGFQIDFNITSSVPLKMMKSYFKLDASDEMYQIFEYLTVDGGLDTYDPDKPCIFRYSYAERESYGYGGQYYTSYRQTRSAWKASDMLAVAYAQSWFVHVLGGPDSRRFRPDPYNQLPMKEETGPNTLFRFRLDVERDVYVYEMVGAYPGGSTDFVSFQGRVRFFQESLTTKTSKLLLKELGVGTPSFPEKLAIVAESNPEMLFVVANALKNIQRFKQQEFLGQNCHVCFENKAKFYVKDTGLKVCGQKCHQQLMH